MRLLAAAGALALTGCGQQSDRVAVEQSAVTSCKAGYSLVCENSDCPPSCLKPICECVLTSESSSTLLRYQVVLISYAPPGNMSAVEYLQGSYAGSHTDYQTTKSIGVDVQFGVGTGVNTVDVENKFKYEKLTGGGHGLQTTNTAGITITANMVSDPAPHHKDLFFVWTNPRLTMTHSLNGGADAFALSSDGPPNVESVTAAELLGEQAIPSSKIVSSLSADERQAIVNMDPFFGGLNLASTRFRQITSLDLTGPDHPGEDFVAPTYNLDTDMSTDSLTGWAVDDELTVLFHTDFIFAMSKAGVDLEYQYQSIVTNTTGTQTAASISLGTSNACVRAGFDVYLDRAFNTFFTVPRSTLSNGVTSSGYNCCGSPHSLCETGAPLDGTCQDDACQAAVCAGDVYCCTSWWDDTCVGEAAAWCGPSPCD